MSHPIFFYDFLVLEKHLDTFGHINNATYLELYEEARWDLIETRGYGLAKIQELKIGPTILEMKLTFSREIRNRERIRVETQIIEHRSKVIRLGQKMINEKGEVASTLELLVALFDMKARRIISPSREWLHAIGIE